MSRTSLLFVAALVLTGCAAKDAAVKAAQSDSSAVLPAAVIPRSEVRILRSQSVQEEFKIFVALPAGVVAGKKYPVIYTLDGNGEFGMVTEIVRLATIGGGEIPPAIIVGIGYPVEEFEATMSLRTRDYTPTSDTGFTRFAAGWTGEPPGASGGAPALLRFITDELKPFIEKLYPVDPADATLMGHSLGGLFTTYALLRQPAAFQRYVIASPSLWWDDKVAFELEKQYAADHKDLAATVFLSVGELESAAEARKDIAAIPGSIGEAARAYYAKVGYPEMVGLLEPFAKTLEGRHYPSLRMSWYVFPGETHMSVMPMIASRGLREVFKPKATGK